MNVALWEREAVWMCWVDMIVQMLLREWVRGLGFVGVVSFGKVFEWRWRWVCLVHSWE